MLDLDECLEVAQDAARRGGQVLIDWQGRFSVHEKAPADLVTSADLAAQEAIVRTIAGAFPGHTFLGEESGLRPNPAEPARWIIDPLDGTVNYVHGLPFFCVSIGLEWAGQLAAGVIYDPLAERMFRARAGGGAFLDGKPLAVSRTAELARSLVATGFPIRLEGRDYLFDLFKGFTRQSHSLRRTGSTALSLAYLAAGAFDVMYSLDLNPWDAAAGVVLIREAGGAVTGIGGGPYDLYQSNLLASNGLLHDQAVKLAAGIVPGADGSPPGAG